MTEDEETVDALCLTHGPYRQRILAVVPDMPPIRSRCPECEAAKATEQDDQRKRQAIAARQLEVQRLTGAAGVPQRFRNKSFADFVSVNKRARSACNLAKRFAENFPSDGQSLVFTGGPGTGKTHLACSIANAIIESSLASVRFLTVTDMLRQIKETYRKDAVLTETQVIAGFVACDLLIVDEVGVQVGSDHEKLLLFEVFNARYSNMAPTIVISNLAVDELEDYLGHRVMDRYRECGLILAFDWDSYRGRKAA